MSTTITAMPTAIIPDIAAPRFFISPDARWVTDKDGAAILNVESGRFHSLVSAGSLVWYKLIACQDGVTVNDIVEDLLAHGEFVSEPRHQTEQAVERMLNKLTSLGIVYTSDKPHTRFATGVRSWSAAMMASVMGLVASILIRLGFYALATFLHLLMFDLTIKIAGFRKVYHTLKNSLVARHNALDSEGILHLCEAADRACVWYPKQAMCLPRSVAMTCMLRQAGVAAVMVIAAQKNPFKGHAWVEVDGIVVNDKPKVQIDYNTLERI